MRRGNGRPKNFDREKYWWSFIGVIALSVVVFGYAQRMQADVRSWLYPLQMAGYILFALLFGVAGGCLVGTFTYERGALLRSLFKRPLK